jgi:tetratricopeptide (TPR) repeat protein
MDDTRLAGARALLAVDRTAAALEQVHRVLAESPEDADAWCLLAMCHRRDGDSAGALRAAERAVALRPDSEWAHRVHAEMLRQSRRYPAAVTAARRAVELAPQEWRAQVTLVHTLLDAGGPDLAQAVEPMATALALAPDVADTYVLAGRVHARLEQPEEARACWQRALELEPDNTAAQALLARDDLAQGRTTAGVAGLRTVLRTDPTNPTVPATVARIRVELIWRATRWAALAATLLGAGLLALHDGPWRGRLTPLALALLLGVQALLLRGYPEGLRAMLGDARRGPDVRRIGLLFLAGQWLCVAWAGLTPDPLRPNLFTVPAYLLIPLFLLAPLAWLLGEQRRPAIRALLRLLRRAG